MKMQYFTSQIQEVSLTPDEVIDILLENVALRAKLPTYDFDHTRPVVIRKIGGGITLRFVQKFMLVDGSPSSLSMTPLKKYELKTE